MKIVKITLLNLVIIIGSGWVFPLKQEDGILIAELEKSLRHDLLNAWYPLSLDTVYGGFLSGFTFDWQPRGPQNKMLVTQSRHIWTASEAAMFYNDSIYGQTAEHGFLFLKERMWDKEYGGFYSQLNRRGEYTDSNFGNYKITYGNAFAIYALVSYYRMSGDTSALNLAKRTFAWINRHSYDPQYKGYFNVLRRDGSWPSTSTDSDLREISSYLSAANWKDQNTSIHLLEAFTELYRVWPDNTLEIRLLEMLSLIRNTIMNKKGYLVLFFERDWTPVSFRDSADAVREANYYFDHISFGHNVETAYLMLEASHVLGIDSDFKTITYARKLVDHALANGWDKDRGGFYDAGYYFKGSENVSIINNAKVWWAQAEGLNALLLMAKLFPGDDMYYNAFMKQWEYIDKYLIDHKYRGWYEEGLDNSPDKLLAPKAYDWKINYHNSRALMNCIKLLKSD
ncbi:MAG: AGE family epimerase/isomerase [Bacteroidales bacterium]|nr:MAG: AGE family epimerase/isomerase [Bacteroidales bacterium]